jgi:CPA1 family monovalent cation:H+ antiporter
VGDLEFLILLLVAVALLVLLARQLDVPYPIVLVLGGLGLGALPGLPELALEPEVVFLVFVPPLVHAAGYTASPRRIARDWVPISMAAVVLVALTIAAVAVAARALTDLDWAAAIVLATVLAPTDLVAATAVFRRLGAPERVVSLVEGENLVNDGTALTAWRLAVAAAVAGSFSLGDAVVELLLVAGGGTLLGVAIGYAVALLRRRVDDALIEITITLLTPYVAFILAEELGLSGILAAVVTGVYLGARDTRLTDPTTRLQAYGFWGVLIFLLESLLFILVGLQFPTVLDAVGEEGMGDLFVAGVALARVVMGVRLAYQFVVPGLDTKERLVVGWSGMRGAISLAVALAVPEEVAARDEIIFLAICVIVITLVVQGLTLPALIRRVRFAADMPDARREVLARFASVQAALDQIGTLTLEESGRDRAALERARSLYAQRANQLAGECRDGVPVPESDTEGWLRLRLELLGVEAARLGQLRDEGDITTPVMNAVQRDVDLEISRLKRRLEPA